MGKIVTLDVKSYPDPAVFGRVAVLMGGWSAEREISLKSGAAVLKALRQHGVDAHGVDVSRATVIKALETGNYDRAFIILHGPGGEDGVIQALLEVLGIPYTGAGVAASALAMDKLRTKQLLLGAGLPTPEFMLLDENTDHEFVAASLGLPLIIKPALEGSSIGMTKVSRVAELQAAYQCAAEYSGSVLAERWITGKEYTVAIVGDEALPVIRLETPRTFYDYTAKYLSDDTLYHCPCGLDEEEEKQLQRLALSAFAAIGVEGWGRVDIMTDEEARPYIIELNTVPGMTDHSLVPMAAKARNISFEQLVYRILAQTLTSRAMATAHETAEGESNAS